MESIESSTQTTHIDFISQPAEKWDVNAISWESFLSRNLSDLSEKSSDHDAVLSVEGYLFYVRKELLCIWSPYFKSLFSENFKNEVGSPFVIAWPLDVFKLLLLMIYTQCDIGHSTDLKKHIFRLTLASDYFNVVSVLLKCQIYIIDNFATLDPYMILEVAFVLNWEVMKARLSKYFKQSICPQPIKKDHLSTLSMDCKDFLLKTMFNGEKGSEKSEEAARTEPNLSEMSYLTMEQKTFQSEYRSQVMPENFAFVMTQLLQPNCSQDALDKLKRDVKFGELVLSVMSPIQAGIDMANFESLILYAYKYQIGPMMLKCLDYMDTFLEDTSTTNLLKLTRIATKMEHVDVMAKLQKKSRAQFTPGGGTMKWMNDNQEEILKLNYRCKSFILDCLYTSKK